MSHHSSKPASYPSNGRALSDDAIEVFLSILTNGTMMRDNVRPHTDLFASFPYVGAPHKARSAQLVAASVQAVAIPTACAQDANEKHRMIAMIAGRTGTSVTPERRAGCEHCRKELFLSVRKNVRPNSRRTRLGFSKVSRTISLCAD
jgi:hypothetical protein